MGDDDEKWEAICIRKSPSQETKIALNAAQE